MTFLFTFKGTATKAMVASGPHPIDDSPSPCSNPCRVKVGSTRRRKYRNDPYRAKVIALGAALEDPSHTLDDGVLEDPSQSGGLEMEDPRAFPEAACVAALEDQTAAEDQTEANEENGVRAQIVAATMRKTKKDMPIPKPRSKQLDKYYTVKFKRSQGTFCVPFSHEESVEYNEGDVVVVEGDRGQNVGVILEHVKVPTTARIGRVIRHASDSELISVIDSVRAKERDAVEFSRKHVKELNLQMTIEDAEFQCDFKKLTIYYYADAAVDFRQLQRILYREFRCRIWLTMASE